MFWTDLKNGQPPVKYEFKTCIQPQGFISNKTKKKQPEAHENHHHF